MPEQKRKRPTIPETTKLELWARAAGRCEFRGCNKLLYKDELTQKRSNLAIISHIVSFSPDGPRGDPVRSIALEKDPRNLILTCRDHGKIVDDKAREHEYPEELLLEFKQEHEQRVRLLTGITEDAQTHVLLLQACIDGRDFAIDGKAAFQAILPKYPAEEAALIISLTGVAVPTDAEGFFPVAARAIAEQTRDILRPRADDRRIKHLSVFALAPIPLLVHFGHLLGDINHVDLYQRHRGDQGWAWKDEEAAEEFYEVVEPTLADEGANPIALLLSLSGPIDRDQVAAVLGPDALVHEIRATSPGLDCLPSRARLEVFGYEARKLLTHLREVYCQERIVHVFAAVPAPVAIEFGRSIRAYDPAFVIYEHRKGNRSYFPALDVNPRPGKAL